MEKKQPSGAGKTKLVNDSIALTQNSAAVIRAHGNDLVPSNCVRNGCNPESAVVDIFNEVKKTLPKPVILFIDDFECLLNESEKISPEACRRITTELLVQIDDCDKQPGVSVIVAATSKPWDICCPVRKRFDRLVYVTLPDQQARFAIIKHEFTNFQHNLTDEFFEYLASVTERFSCSDLVMLARDACWNSVRKLQNSSQVQNLMKQDEKMQMNLKNTTGNPSHNQEGRKDSLYQMLNEQSVLKCDVDDALLNMKKSVDDEEIAKFESFNENYGQD